MYSTHCILNIKLTKLKIPLCWNSSKIDTLTCMHIQKMVALNKFYGTCTQFNANKITIRHLDLILKKNTGSSSTFIQQIDVFLFCDISHATM